MLVALGAAAGVAIENARLYDAARRQQRWIQASAEVTTKLLSGSEPGEVLADITRQALQLSGADLAVLARPDEEEPSADHHPRRGRRCRRDPRPGPAGRPVPVRPGAGHRGVADVRRLRRRRAGLQGGPRRDEPDRARGRVPARRAGQRPRRAHHRTLPRRGAVPAGPGRPGGLVRGAGWRRARTRGQPPGRRTARISTRTGTGSPATCTTWSSSGSTPPACRWREPCR